MKDEAWKWQQAPVKTQWGHDMVVADLAIDKDHTASVYCERDQTAKVEALFTPPAAQRQWAVPDTMKVSTAPSYEFANGWNACVAAIKAKLKEKNNV